MARSTDLSCLSHMLRVCAQCKYKAWGLARTCIPVCAQHFLKWEWVCTWKDGTHGQQLEFMRISHKTVVTTCAAAAFFAWWQNGGTPEKLGSSVEKNISQGLRRWREQCSSKGLIASWKCSLSCCMVFVMLFLKPYGLTPTVPTCGCPHRPWARLPLRFTRLGWAKPWLTQSEVAFSPGSGRRLE